MVFPRKVTDLSKDKEQIKVFSDYLSLSKIEKEEVAADKTGKILRWLKLAQKASGNPEKEDESSAA